MPQWVRLSEWLGSTARTRPACPKQDRDDGCNQYIGNCPTISRSAEEESSIYQSIQDECDQADCCDNYCSGMEAEGQHCPCHTKQRNCKKSHAHERRDVVLRNALWNPRATLPDENGTTGGPRN
jgi:hypothetical protein